MWGGSTVLTNYLHHLRSLCPYFFGNFRRDFDVRIFFILKKNRYCFGKIFSY